MFLVTSSPYTFNGPDQLKRNLCLEKSRLHCATQQAKTHPAGHNAYTTVYNTSSRYKWPYNIFLSPIDNSLHESVMALLGDWERIRALCVRKHGNFFS